VALRDSATQGNGPRQGSCGPEPVRGPDSPSVAAPRGTRGERHATPKAKAQARTRDRIYAKRRNGGHPRAHRAAPTRQRSSPTATLEPQARSRSKAKGLRLSGVGSPTPAIQASNPAASCQIKGDLTAPGRQRQNQPAPARTPAAAAPATAPGTPARRKPAPARPPGPAARRPWHAKPQPPAHRKPARKGRPARSQDRPPETPRPGTGNQPAESGQSQEPRPGKPDINPYTGTKQAPDSNRASFRIIAVTSLYRHCRGTVQGSRTT